MITVEIGPAMVRAVRHADAQIRTVDAELACAALAGVDDPYVLVGDNARPTRDVWAQIWDELLDGDDESVVIVPSTWPAARVDAVCDTMRGHSAALDIRRRWEAVAAGELAPRTVAVIEIGPELVGLTLSDAPDGTPSTLVLPKDGTPEDVARRVRALVGVHCEGHVLVDCPAGVDDISGLRAALSHIGVRTIGLSTDNLLAVAADPGGPPRRRPDAGPAGRRLGRLGRVGWAAAAVVAAVGVVMLQAGTSAGPVAQPVTVVVEGAVTVNVPALWPVEKVTEGAGSARLRVNSPYDDGAALHVTQSRVPDGETLAAAAETLRRAVAAQAPGVFVDFNPSDVRVGRPAITYREVRDAHDILWSVLIDGVVRISIGCQSARGRAHQVSAACDEAVRSAHATV